MSILQRQFKSSSVVILNFVLMTFSLWTVNLQAQCTPFDGATSNASAGTGNQAWAGRLGLRFTANSLINITRLGAYDSGADGFTGTITVGIVNSSGAVVVPAISMTGSSDLLVGNFRMRNITPVVLSPGQYTVVSYGYSASDPNYNSNNPANLFATVNTGSGLITHDDSPWDNTAAMGVPSNTHSVGGFHAGNFSFSAVQPILSATINGTTISTNTNGVDDTGSFTICSGPPTPNVTMGLFTAGVTGGPLVKVYQEINFNNAVQSGAWCSGTAGSGCSAVPSAFAGATNTFTKVNALIPGSVILRFLPYFDANNNNILDAEDCQGDWAVFTVNFETQAPVVTCPANISVTALPTECTALVNYATPTTSDLPCTGPVTLVQTAGLPSGSAFPVGLTTNVFLATDASGNTATCSFTVTVRDYVTPPLACKPVQISLDEDCEGTLTPTTVLAGWEGPGGAILLGCEDLYSINVTGANGENLGNTVGQSQLGKTLQYTITNVNGFTCWGDVKVEDKIAPTIICRDISVSCLADLSKVAGPVVSDNCTAKAVLVNEVHAALSCDALYIGTVTRTYIAEDNAGNKSLPCTQTIYLLRSSVTGITPPPTSYTLRCSDVYKRDTKGFNYPHPDTTGVPSLGGTKLYPLSQLNMVYCNSTIDYTDQLVVNTKCKTRILRTWSITEWWCSTAVTKFVSMQLIDIIDDVAPVIPQQANSTVTTQTRSCSAAVTLPKLSITDNCNVVYRVYINAVSEGLPTGYINTNGGKMDLGVGTHTVTYTAIDDCGNTRSMSYRITVQDETDPVAICDQFATVSIKTNGYTEVTASAIDDGSFDECGAVTLKVRRMEDPCSFGHDTAWYDKVGFCCLDANTTRMVQLLVTDKGGNTNICMVSVNVQEKVTPTITCPADRTVEDCLFTFDPSLTGANAAFGAATINDNCPANNTLDHTLVDNRNQCGVGTVVRTFSVRQGAVVYQTCTQTITFRNNEPFYINYADHQDPTDDIIWPKDYLANGQCSFAGLLPETLPDSSSTPKVTEDACDLVGMRYEDQIFRFTTNGTCYKIIRKWTVIDWCQRDENNEPATWSHEQEIKVVDRIAPEITVPVSPVVFQTLSCFSDDVTLSATAKDCTPAAEIKWSYTIRENGQVIGSGNSSTVTDEFEVGKYSITFQAEDRCGNLSEKSYNFEVKTIKSPTAVCKQGLAAPLVLMDTDGNGTGDTPMTMLNASFFDNKSSHVCGYDIQLSFSSDVNDTVAVFGCADIGPQEIELWVTDENGNTAFCTTFVDIQANGLCVTPPSLLANVSGKAAKENNEEIQNVTVEMKGSEQNPELTNVDGRFAFAPMPVGGNYDIVPSKDGDDMNGVSTLDIVMIQRHILGIEKLKSPYLMIAADANNSGSVTASDLTELRKLVLGLLPSLPNNTSWRFVDAAYQFANSNDPWLTPFPEKYQINGLTSNMDINFVGVKVGDVNGNAKGHNATENSTESRSAFSMALEDKYIQKGDIMEIPVMAATDNTLYGYQGQWTSKGLVIRDIREASIPVKTSEYVLRDVNNALMSISVPEGLSLVKNEVMYTIEVEALTSGKLSEMLYLGKTVNAEAYIQDMSTRNVTLSWRDKTDAVFAVTGITPNPWNANAAITFELPESAMVTFKVRDYTGRKVMSTIDQYQTGQNTIYINRSDIGAAGVYVYELRYNDKVIAGKMIVVE